MSYTSYWTLSNERIRFAYNPTTNRINWSFDSGSKTVTTFAGDLKTHYMTLKIPDNNFILQSNSVSGTIVGKEFGWGNGISPETFRESVLPYLPFVQAASDTSIGDAQFRYTAYQGGSVVEDYWMGKYSDSVQHYYRIFSESTVPDIPDAPTFTATYVCSGGTTSTWQIEIPSPDSGVTYYSVRKASGLTSTYEEVTKLYVSGGTFIYNDTTGVDGYYKVYAVNMPWQEESTNTEEVRFSPVIQAQVVWNDYPTLTFTAQTTNFCADIDNVLWYLDGVLTGNTTGNTFTGVLPTETDVYELTAKYVRSGVTGSTSNIVELIFFYTGTTRICFTGNTDFEIPNYYNRMDYAIVAGGGGGGNARYDGGYFNERVCSGGGGAGGFLTGTINNVSGGTYSVVIGAGGGSGSNGSNSSFYGLTAIGGGKGGSVSNNITNSGSAGGSGGGGAGTSNPNGFPTAGGAGTSGQGNNGAAGASSTTTSAVRGGGGGGKGSAGSGGSGGAGLSSSISGGAVTYANGGGTRTTQGDGVGATLYGGGGGGACSTSENLYWGGAGKQGIVCVYLYNYYPQQPTAATNLQATLIGCDDLKLTWTNTDVIEVDGIHIQQLSGGTWVTIDSVAFNATQYTVTGLTPDTNYQFRVVTYNELFNVASSSVYPTTLSAIPFGVNVTPVNLEGSLTYGLHDTGYGTSVLALIRVSGETAWVTGATLAMSATSYTFTGLSFNTDYEVMVVRQTVDGDYESSIFEFSTNDFDAPTINGYLVENDVTIEIFDDNPNKEYYEIYRDAGGTGFTLVDTIYYTGTTWTDYDIESGITYTYKVRCKLETDFTPTQYSDYSNEIDARIFVLLAPTGLTISDVGYTGLTLTWVNNNVSGITGNYVQRLISGIWTTIDNVSSGTTSIDVQDLLPNTLYYFRVVAYNDVQTANSATVHDTTLNPTPYGLSATTLTLFYQDLIWELPAPEFGDSIRVEYRLCETSDYTVFDTIASDATQIKLTGLTYGQCYEIVVVSHSDVYGDYYSEFLTIEIPVPNYPPAFCDAVNYSYSGTTCGNNEGYIKIDNQEYFTYYTFSLTDIFGNTYPITFEVFENLPSGYFFLTATVRPEFWWWYGRDACIISWIKIEDYDNPTVLVSTSVKPQQCQPFDVQRGRIYFNVSGLTSGHTYSFYAFTEDLSLYYIITGATATTEFILRNATAQCYYVIIIDEVTGCKLILDRRCLPTIPTFSLAGIQKIWIANWSDDLDYNYWKDSDDDYFLEFEDTSFFNSTKIKEYLSHSGGTIQWYRLPVAEKYVNLTQKLQKVRQGFLFKDTLSIAITKATADKWTKIATILNPENKWVYVVKDDNGFYWTGGYRHGAGIETYSFNTGNRGDDDGYQLLITCESENKLLTNLDENYVINNIE